MEPAAYAKIRRNPKFVELVRQRGALARNLTIAMLVDLFRLHPAGRLRQGLPRHADQRRLGDDHRHPDRPVRHRLGLRADRDLCRQGQHDLRRPQRPDPRGEQVMRATHAASAGSPALGAGLLLAGPALAAGAIEGATTTQPTNWTAIVMFLAFVLFTLAITKWAASKTKSAADFYAAGGGITGFQNSLAIAGDYMSAASFLGISGLVFVSGFDGLIYSVGFLVGWPIVLFLIAERLRNLGKFTFADVASYRLQQTPIRHAVGRRHADRGGLLPDRADGRRRQADPAPVRPALPLRADHRRRADDRLRHLRRHARHHLGADHQGLHAAGRRHLHGVHGPAGTSASAPRRCSRPRPRSTPRAWPS